MTPRSGGADDDLPPGIRRPMPPSVPPRGRQDPPPSVPPSDQRRTADQRRTPGAPARRTTRPASGAQASSPGRRPAPSASRPGPAVRRDRLERAAGNGERPPTREAPPRPASSPRKRKRRWPRVLGVLTALVLAVLIASTLWVESRIEHVTALSGAPGTPGQTYLIVGSDSREGWREDGTTGARTDTIMLLHQPTSGPTSLISIPRDSLVDIPGYGQNKINAAYAFGGPTLLVQTVEQLSGLTVDRYIEVGFLGVENMVNALGGVELCHDSDVNDPYSELVWTAGCHTVDGATALAFSRMRHADPLGDIGRVQRQQQVVSAVAQEVMTPSTLLNPFKGPDVASAGLDSFRVSDGAHAWDLARMALAFNEARGADAVKGTPPIASIDYRVEGVGSTVLLDPDTSPQFWADIASGAYPPGTQVGGY